MSDSTKAVFLSYAREDTPAAQRIAEALRSHGVEVWFDQDELRGGDAWDQKIRRQIADCALFLPLISRHTQERGKGYFRLEWKLAVEQTHLMLEGIPFIAPVVVDETSESGAAVPGEFMKVQWTRLPGALPSPQFVGQIKRLLAAPRKAASSQSRETLAGTGQTLTSSATNRRAPVTAWIAVALGVVVLGAVGFFALRRSPQQVAATKTVSTPPASLPSPTSLAPLAPDKSIAVLPFENLSPDKDNAFFADGVHEDVITSLTKIRDLKVIARTSVLQYRDTSTRNHKKIAADLGVATLLEGTVRRAGTKVRVTAQLINARTDESLWAETYDVDLTDAFTIQSALAQNITAALKVNFTAGERAYIAERPTQNLEAYDLYVRGRTIFGEATEDTKAKSEQVVALYEQAVAKDPTFVAACAQLSFVNSRMYWFGNLDPTPARRERAKAALDAAVRLAPDKPETRFALGAFAYYCDNDWGRALGEFRAAAAALPNDAQLAYFIGLTHRRLGASQDAAVYMARSMELNPRDATSAVNYMQTLFYLRRFSEVRDLGVRFAAIFQVDPGIHPRNARLELGHDVAAYIRELEATPPGTSDPNGLKKQVSLSMVRGDFAAAERVLADPRFPVVYGTSTVINEPAVLQRALFANLRGQREAAQAFADEAVAYYRAQAWTPRQTGLVMIGTALAHALAGRSDEALKLAREGYAWQKEHDQTTLLEAREVLARIYLVLDRRDDAFAVLREMMTGPSPRGPEELRLDPLWKRVKDDPRFEKILKLAKPL